MYQPHEGETIYVDNIRLSAKPQAGTPFLPDEISPPHKFKVLGSDREAIDASDLADQLKDQFIRPKDQTIEEVEVDIRAAVREPPFQGASAGGLVGLPRRPERLRSGQSG